MDQLHVLSLALDAVDECETPDAPLSKSPERSDDESTSLVYRRVRRQVVARGLARHHGDPKPKEGHQRARSTRLQKQLAIIEEYHRTKARDEARMKKLQEEAELNRSKSATTIAPQSAVKFVRKISLRQLPPASADSPSKNQHDESASGALSSPRAADIEAYAALASREGAFSPKGRTSDGAQPFTSTKAKSTKSKKDASGGRGAPNKSTAQVMCELKLNKDIMMREHVVEQIHGASSALEKLAIDLHDLSIRKTRLENAALAGASATGTGVGALLARRSSISSGMMTSPKKEKSNTGTVLDDGSINTDVLEDLNTKLSESTQLVKRRVTQLNRLITTYQTATMNIVDCILQWREQKSQRVVLSNIDKLYRFAWKTSHHHVKNYLAHVDSDMRDLFPSATMNLVLGILTKYNPMLLPRPVIESLGIPDDTFVSTTFLTERGSMSSPEKLARPLSRVSTSDSPSPTRRQAHVALYNTVKALGFDPVSDTSRLDLDRVRRCLEAIRHEVELERLADEREVAEKQRHATAYNPFEAIKVAGGVEDTIGSVLKHKPPSEALKLAEELRRRQEDATRAKDSVATETTASSETSTALHVNPRRLRLLVDQRNEALGRKADCELHDTTSAWTKNKLRGQVMMRKKELRHLEHQHARKIQRQFQAYRRRTQLLKNLTHFVMHTRQRVVSIQKLVRGYIAKRRYQEAKERHEWQKLRFQAAKLIWSTYKRYKHRLRHHHSMSVEAIAQIQLTRVQQHQLDEASTNDDSSTSSAERYRRVGEERRRQRAAQLLKKRQELLELEAKKIAAATRIQSVYRMHSAKQLAVVLRGERRAHMSAVSAMMIQSKIRKFLKYQERRRLKFRSDMERVNRSAVRIQAIYRGYNSRASLVVGMDDQLKNLSNLHQLLDGEDDFEEEDEDEDFDEEAEDEELSRINESYTVLPQIIRSRPSTSGGSEKIETMRPNSGVVAPQPVAPVLPEPTLPLRQIQSLSLPPIRSRAQSVETASVRKAQPPPPEVRRQSSNGTMKVELKLKEPVLGDDFDAPSHAARMSHGGSFRRRFSRSSSGLSDGTGTSATGTPQG